MTAPEWPVASPWNPNLEIPGFLGGLEARGERWLRLSTRRFPLVETWRGIVCFRQYWAIRKLSSVGGEEKWYELGLILCC